jgi:Protein phosphatase 2C
VRVHSDSFWVQKSGNLENEFEDACWPKQSICRDDLEEFRFAIADGATETSFSALWAKLLVRSYGKGRIKKPVELADLAQCQKLWHRLISKIDLPWYAEQKVKDGAFSSLAGITLFAPKAGESTGSWCAIAVGDSCIVQIREEQPPFMFPFNKSLDFNSRPLLLSSNPSANIGLVVGTGIFQVENTWKNGDKFLLMTDALACWFMREFENGLSPWNDLLTFDDINGGKEFARWVNDRRNEQVLKNDDVTLVCFAPYL